MNLLRLSGVVCACAISFATLSVNADLLPRLGGLAFYDAAADLTWFADANYAQTNQKGQP